MTPTAAQDVLDTMFAPWVLALQPRVASIDVDHCALVIPITADIARAGGIVSGQVMATLADTAMVLACMGHAGAMIPVSTVTLDTQFLRPGSGDSITARAEVTRAGKGTIFARCTLTAHPSGKDIALATATFAKPSG
ncbi:MULTISPECIES: PaaI family thioesterase [Roseobacteraceae]|uniref:Thioesterase n=1 Tax=Pseudosulfitobacter pseudonitzschiae TaxID=1402135 RepID=A0A221JXQ6_9RHOB|nr:MULTISPECIES: PaaI family thioesterase [Roseobacteraceae]ASM71514.1 thioesterase [Pseudosulfitobacter pseudonitzschiae]